MWFHPELLPGFVGGLCDCSVGRRPPHQAFWNIEKSFLIPITTGTVSGRGPRLWCQTVLDSGLGRTLLADKSVAMGLLTSLGLRLPLCEMQVITVLLPGVKHLQ